MLAEERPYEKCERFGAGSLTDIELLAVLLRTGTKGENSLELARKNDIHSVAFPAISTGVYGYPYREAAELAYGAVTEWLSEHEGYEMKVIFCCFDDRTFEAYREKKSNGEK